MIVDASVAVKWIVEEEGSVPARAFLGVTELMAPTLLHAEVANAIWKKLRRGELADAATLAALPNQLLSIVQTVDETPIMSRALALALAMDHPIYDCIYLALAEELDQELVTADDRFLRVLAGRPEARRVRLLGG